MIDIVEDLVTPYENKGYIICMDRFYTTLNVVKYLSNNNFGVYGSIINSRAKISQKIKEKINILQKYELKFYISSNNDMFLTVWKDTKIVKHRENLENEIERKQKGALPGENLIKASCPSTIQTYSKNARGVDLLDQMISYYSVDVKSKKWYKSIFSHILQISLYNSFLLYKKSTQNEVNFLSYQETIVRYLIPQMRERKIYYQVKKKKNNRVLHQKKYIQQLVMIKQVVNL